MITYVTPSEGDFAAARQVLSTVELVRLDWKLDFETSSDPANAARLQVMHIFSQLRDACFVIKTGLQLNSSESASNQWLYCEDIDTVSFCRRFGGLRGIARHVMAYTLNGRDVHVLVRECPGAVLDVPRGDAAEPIDQIWLPSGYRQTFAELAAFGHAVNRRHLLFFDLAHFLGLRLDEDIYEAHVTVNGNSADLFDRFQIECSRLNVKAIQIALPNGIYPSHLITASFHRGSIAKVTREINALADAIRSAGLPVTRIKLEAMIRNSMVPQTDQEASPQSLSTYFEFHVKITILNGDSMIALKAICDEFGAHLSRNPSNRLARERDLHFATLRVYGRGREYACSQFDAFLAALREAGFCLSNILREYTVLDTNSSLDDGWFPSMRGAACEANCDLLRTLECPFLV